MISEVLSLFSAAASGFIVWMAAAVFRNSAGVSSLKADDSPEPPRWPVLSIVIPARNEASAIRAAFETLRRQNYPALEFILVDDRSTDGTREIIDELAAADSRVVPVHVENLPPGWLGKVHALEEGRARASGEWILFTDADIFFGDGMLAKAIACAERHAVDHLVVVPSASCPGFVSSLVNQAFIYLLLLRIPFSKIGVPGSDAVMGVGAFNLVRKKTVEDSGGLSWIRMEVADDIGLALLVKNAGGRAKLVWGEDLLRVTMYSDFRTLVRSSDKIFAGFGFRLDRLTGSILFGFSLLTAAAAGFSRAGAPGIVLFSYAATVAAGLYVSRKMKTPSWPNFFIPAGELLLMAIGLRVAARAAASGGIVWRGTRYNCSDLREMRRVAL